MRSTLQRRPKGRNDNSPEKQNREKRVAYGCFPQIVAANTSAIEHWDRLDLPVALALLALARMALGDDKHKERLRIGKRSIKAQLENEDRFRAEWDETNRKRADGVHEPAPKRQYTYDTEGRHRDSMTTRQRIRKAGSKAYHNAKRRERTQLPPQSVPILVTLNKLINIAGLSRCDRNRQAVEAALNRLQEDLEIDGVSFPACIRSVRRIDSTHVKIFVSGRWLLPSFLKVPFQLPKRSTTATRLYLLLLSLDTRERNKKAMHFDQLCERIGIDAKQPYSTRHRALYRALHVVNANLDKIDTSQLWYRDIDIADRFDAVWDRHKPDYIRFVSRLKDDPVEQRVTTAENSGDYERADRLTELSRLGLSRAEIMVIEKKLANADDKKVRMLLNAPDAVLKRLLYTAGVAVRHEQKVKQERDDALDRLN